LLDEEQRRKIRIRELGVFYGSIPLVFLISAVAALIWYYVVPSGMDQGWRATLRNFVYLLGVSSWSVTQGGLGACAFIGTHIISRARRKSDPLSTSDADVGEYTNENYLKMRIILGCLFGLLFGIPAAGVSLNLLSPTLYPEDLKKIPNPFKDPDIVWLFVPFLSGFSTSLVLAILKRLISTAQALFGGAER
jgi:hypothetical protein